MHIALKAILSLSLSLAVASCAAPYPTQPGEQAAAPPTHLGHPAPEGHGATHLDPETGEPMEGALHEHAENPGAPSGDSAIAHEVPAYVGAGDGEAGGGGEGGAEPAPATMEPVSFRSGVVPILRQHCASCHTAGGAGATALTMFDEQGEPQHAAIQEQIGRMLLEIQSGRMPQGKPDSLTTAEFNTLDRWGAAEAPDN